MGKTFAAGLLAIALLSPVLAAAQTTRVGVIAVGSDPVIAGALQSRVDRALAAQKNLVLVPRAELALRLAAGSAVARDDGRLAGLFAQAKEAYFDDRLDEASERVDEAARIIDEGLAVPGSDRTTVLTWRTALALAAKDEAKANEQCRLLLNLAPDTQPDLDVFRPSVKAYVDELRPKLQKPIEIKIEGAPAGARLEVDRRLVDAKFRIGTGRRTLIVRAPGYRAISVPFGAESDRAVVVALALEPGDKALVGLESSVWTDGPSPALSELGTRLGVDAFAIVAARADGTTRAVLVSRGGAPRRSDSFAAGKDPETGVASWLTGVLAPGAKAPIPTATPRATRDGALAWTVDAGLAFAQRSRAVEASGGAGFDAAFTGAGGFVDGEAWLGRFVGGARGGWTHYFSTATFEMPDGTDASVVGGQTMRMDLCGGARVFGSAERSAVTALVEAVYETHRAEDLADDQGDLGFFASYNRIAAGAGVRGETSFSRVRAHAGVSVHPLHLWTESEEKTGTKPSGAPAFGLRAGAAMPVASAWEVQTEYLGELRSVAFDGPADMPTDPAVQDAKVSEQVHSLSLTLRRRF